MSIYKKLAHIQCELLKKDIPKSGKNNHKGFRYHELEDLIPPIFEECMKQELTLVFTFVENAAVLKLRDWNSKDEISVRVTTPELVIPEKNPNNQLIQAVGANVTYLKRYLLVNTFLITEKEVIDSDNPSKKSEPVKEVADVNVPLLLVEAEKKLKSKGVEDKDITPQTLKMTVRKLQKWNPSEMRAINNYFKENDL